MEQEKLNLFDAMLNASSFDDLVKYADYIEIIGGLAIIILGIESMLEAMGML